MTLHERVLYSTISRRSSHMTLLEYVRLEEFLGA